MKVVLQGILASRKSIYLAALASALFVLLTGWVIFFSNAAGMAFLFFVLAVLFISLFWVCFVSHILTIINRQTAMAVTKAMSKQNRQIEKSFHERLDKNSEHQVKEYRIQALNTLMKLEQLRLTPYGGSRGSHED